MCELQLQDLLLCKVSERLLIRATASGNHSDMAFWVPGAGRFSDPPGRIVSTVGFQVLEKILVFVGSKQNLKALREGLSPLRLVFPFDPVGPLSSVTLRDASKGGTL